MIFRVILFQNKAKQSYIPPNVIKVKFNKNILVQISNKISWDTNPSQYIDME